MDIEQYNKTMKLIDVSEEKRKETCQLLSDIVNKNNNNNIKLKQSKNNLKVIAFGMIALLTLVILLVNRYVGDANNINIDVLSDDMFKERIILSDGELVFSPMQSMGEAKMVTPEGDKVGWTLEQVNEYMGKDIHLKYVPAKLIMNNLNESQFVYIRNDETISYDNITYTYSENINDYESARLSITVSKGKLPVTDHIIYGMEKSNIRGVVISIVCINESYYNASFIYEGIGYEIKSSHVSQKEFIEVLLSIIE